MKAHTFVALSILLVLLFAALPYASTGRANALVHEYEEVEDYTPENPEEEEEEEETPDDEEVLSADEYDEEDAENEEAQTLAAYTLDNSNIANNNTNSTESGDYCADGQKRKSKLVVFLFSILLGNLGVDRFYTGYVAYGVVKLLTGGVFGVWSLVDWILVLVGQFNQTADGCLFKVDM